MTAIAKSPVERIPPMGIHAIRGAMLVGLVGGFLACPKTPAHQAFELFLDSALIVLMAPMFVHPIVPKWKWVSRPKDQMVLAWFARVGFILFGVYFVRSAYELIGSLVTS